MDRKCQTALATLVVLLLAVSPCVARACDAALLVIDVQELYLTWQPWQTATDESIVVGVARAIDLARENGIPVIYIQECYPYPDPGEGVTLRPELAIVDEISPKTGEPVFRKSRQSAFTNPALEEYLRSHGIQRLLACGIASSACVFGTVNAAVALGFDVTLVGDAHSDLYRGSADTALRWNVTYERMGVPAPLSAEIDWESFACAHGS